MRAYVVMVTPEAHISKVSQEGYDSLEKAQAFIEGRSGNPQKMSEYRYRDEDYTEYEISEIIIK